MAVTLQGADQGDTTMLGQTVAEAGEQIATVLAHPEAGEQVNPQGLEEVVAWAAAFPPRQTAQAIGQ